MSPLPTDGQPQESQGQTTRLPRLITNGVPFSALPVNRKVGLAQMPMLLAVITSCILAAIIAPEQIFGDSFFVAGVLLTVLSSVAAWVFPWDRRRARYLYLTIPGIGLVSATLMSLGAYSWLSGVSLLIAFPIFWFAWSGRFPRLTLLLSFVVPLIATWLQLSYHGLLDNPGILAKPLLVPLTILALAATTVIVEQNSALAEHQLRATLDSSRHQEHLLNAVLNAANVGVVVVDRDGHDVFMNDIQRFQHRHASPKDNPDPNESQLLVRDVNAAYEPAPELLEPAERPVRRAIERGNFTDELFALGPLNDPMYLSVSARSFFDETDEYDGVAIMFKNITPLIEASQTRNRFLANVSHELRTPLTSMLGYLELLEDDPTLDGTQRQAVDVLSRNSDRMLRLVNDLLTAAAGHHQVKVASMDLGSLIHSQIQSSKPQAATAGITLVEGALCHEPMLGDPLRLGQVVDNLISNAIKYTAAGGSISVEMSHTNTEISFRVADTGRGISQKDLKGLFARFFRTDDARRSGVPGVGLGLAISHELVEAHGGRLIAESALGVGTTMTVTLPRQR